MTRLSPPRLVHRVLALISLLMLVGLVAPLAASVAAQDSRSVVWDEYNVTFDIREDGTVHVTETQVVEFTGSFRTGFANIPLNRTESLENLEVSIANGADADPVPAQQVSFFREEPNTYAYDVNFNTLELDYAYEPTSTFGSTADNTRIVVMEYDLVGAVRVYEDLDPANQQFRWVAVESDVTDIAPIRSSTVTITLPEAVDPAQTVAQPEGVETDGQVFTWTRENLRSGQRFEVNLQFPPITAATVPDWQARDDQTRAQELEQEEQSAVAGTLFLGSGLLLLVGGTLGLIGIWFARGRDPEIGLVADIIPEPPDDLRPGAAGTLVDEETHPRDVIATLFDLARRGVLRMDQQETEGFFGFGKRTTHTLTLLEHSEQLAGYEDNLLDAIFGLKRAAGDSASLGEVQQAFAQRADVIYGGFYNELVEHGYFDASPEKTRQRAKMLAWAGPILAAVVIFLVLNTVGAGSGFIVLPILAAIVLFVVGNKVANHMPRKTLKGAEAAAKWNAFKRYLQDIEQHANLEESKAIFERYLPYAEAFGLEDSWIRKFAQVDTPMPGWFGPGPVVIGQPGRVPGGSMRRRGPGGGVWVFPSGGGSFGGGTSGGGSGGGGGFDMPTLQEGSDATGRSLQSGSDSIFDMLGTAADIFGGGGGRSGGGSFGSWGGGGGGFGGFSGGGGFGGGGGGGSRGFG